MCFSLFPCSAAAQDRREDALPTVHGAFHDALDVLASVAESRRRRGRGRVPPLRPGRGSPGHLLLLHLRHRPAAGAACHRAVGEAGADGASASREPVDDEHIRVDVRRPVLPDLHRHGRRVCAGAELLGPDHRRGRQCGEPRHDRLQHAAAPRLCLAAGSTKIERASWYLNCSDRLDLPCYGSLPTYYTSIFCLVLDVL
uniref:Uncharacterized protein n=1 Tax=Aegilops tauschii subsp. strangulata TaxID=200361 RepID=A0A453B6B1_AEGTS